MKKYEVTILIPAVSKLAESPVVESFIETGLSEKIYVQFVLLCNPKNSNNRQETFLSKFKNHEILIVFGDRYFATAEENIYRVQDFIGLFKKQVFCVGEHDIVDWNSLIQAIDFFESNNLENMAWNVLNKQVKADESYFESPSLIPISDCGVASSLVDILFSGNILSSEIGYGSLISIYGPIDWCAFIGNHLFSRNSFERILQFRFTEFIYSFVYKQLSHFFEVKTRYGFFSRPVVHRIGDEFNKMRKGEYSFGWLEDHRTAMGYSNCFWIANLAYLVELKKTEAFHLVNSSLCLSQVSGPDGGINYSRQSLMHNILEWSKQVAHFRLTGRSFYFPELTINSSLQDLRYVENYLNKFIDLQSCLNWYSSSFIQAIRDSLLILGGYLSCPNNSERSLNLLINMFSSCQQLLSAEEVVLINQKAFQHCFNYE